MSSSAAPANVSLDPADYVFGVPLTPEQDAVFPHDNGASRLLGSIWALSALATVFLALRVYCRMLKRQSLWWDDGILIASWVSCCPPVAPVEGVGCWLLVRIVQEVQEREGNQEIISG